MNDEQVIEILHKFDDYLHPAGLLWDVFRTMGWIFVQGLAWLLDALENVTNEMLFVKEFFQNESVIEFVTSFRPLLYILLAFSLLYSGYLLIFQRKVQAEALAINFVIALTIITLLSTAMDKANAFTDEAVKTVNSGALFGTEEGTVSGNILAENITDLVQFDKTDWEGTKQENIIPLNMVSKLKITERFDKESLSELKHEDISKKRLFWDGEKEELIDLDQGGLDWNNEYYYRYSLDWFTIMTTMLVMAFTMFSIAYKLARLAFELVFNHLLVMIVAPADLHDGQKTKKIIQSILNTFLVIVLIFMSMKLYIFGTAYLADNFKGLVYIIALMGFSIALLDGPNMVERLFGIDAGLKGGWGLLAGTYAAGKLATNFAGEVGKLASEANRKGNDKGKSDGKGDSKDSTSENSDAKNQNQSPLKNVEAKSPFDEKGTGKESPLKPNLAEADKAESEQTDKNELEAKGNKKGIASFFNWGKKNDTSKDSSVQASPDKENDENSSFDSTSDKVQEEKNQGIPQKSTIGQIPLKERDALKRADTPSSTQQRNSEEKGQVNGRTSHQELTEPTDNITDTQNGIETEATSSQGLSGKQRTAPKQSSEQKDQPNVTEDPIGQGDQANLQRRIFANEPVNITDEQNDLQTENMSSQNGSKQQGTVAERPLGLEPQSPPSSTEDSTVQSGQTDVQRQNTAEQPVNITDVQNDSQTVTTSNQSGSVQQGTANERSSEKPALSNAEESSTVHGGQSDIQQQSNLTQQINVTDTQTSEQGINITSQSGTQIMTTSSQGLSPSPSNTGVPQASGEEQVVSESSSTSSTNEITIQQENVNQVNEEVKIEEDHRTIMGSQSVSHAENQQTDGSTEAVSANIQKVVSEEKMADREGSDRQHVINRKNKKERFNRMKNHMKE